MNASVSVTALRSMLTQLNRDTAQSREALKGTGVSLFDIKQTIKEKGLLEGLMQLDKAVGGSSQKWQKVISDVEGYKGAMVLLKANLEDSRHVFEGMGQSTGALEEAFGPRSQTAIFQYNRLINTVKNDMTQLAGTSLPWVVGALEGAITAYKSTKEAVVILANGIQELLDTTIKFGDTTATVGASVLAMWDWIGQQIAMRTRDFATAYLGLKSMVSTLS